MENLDKLITDDYTKLGYMNNSPMVDPFFLLIRKWRFITFMTFLTLITATGLTLLKPNLYEAETTLIVSSGQLYSVDKLGNEEMLRNQKLVSTYTEIARSRAIMVEVIDSLDLDLDPDKVSELLTIEPLGETELFKLSFKDRNPKVAAIFLDAVSKELIRKTTDAMTFQNLKIIERVQVPDKPVSKNLVLVAVASSILGFLIGAGTVFVWELFYGKLLKPEEFEGVMGCQVLANIPRFKDIDRKEGPCSEEKTTHKEK